MGAGDCFGDDSYDPGRVTRFVAKTSRPDLTEAGSGSLEVTPDAEGTSSDTPASAIVAPTPDAVAPTGQMASFVARRPGRFLILFAARAIHMKSCYYIWYKA